MKKSFIQQFTPAQKAEILDYGSDHSSRATAAFIEKTYGLKVSHVTVTKMLEKHYEELPIEVKQVKYMAAKDINHVRQYLVDTFDEYIKQSTNPDNPLPVQLNYRAGAVELGLKIAKMSTEILKTPVNVASATTTETKEEDSLGWTGELGKGDDEDEAPVVEGQGEEK